jgi:DNA helicase-2/ATP-dependent DNA helicase PcrA
MKGAFGDCYARFTETLDRYRFLTFGQLICRAVRALGRPVVIERVHGPLKYLFVDEYQDINPAQDALIRILAQPPVRLCVVGDDDQAIYQWRGSDVANILGFVRRYECASLPLTANRRSRPAILKAANTFARTIKPRIEKEMTAKREAAALELHAWSAETPEQEAAIIADAILELQTRGYRLRDIAVLFRSVRTSSPPLVEALRSRGIRFSCAGRTGLFLHPEAEAFGQLYAWLTDNEWKSERFGTPVRVDLETLLDSFAGVFNGGRSVSGLSDLLDTWRTSVSDNSRAANLVADYYRLLHVLEAHRLDIDDPDNAARMGILARFSQILADFEHVKRRSRWVIENDQWVFKGGQDRGDWFHRRLFNYLQHYALEAYEDFGGEPSFDLDVVDILTVHQAKGLEWPVVFIPSLVQGRFPSGRAGRSQEWLLDEKVFPARKRARYEGSETEERRLFYVALTRARDAVYLSSFERKARRFQPSVFLSDIGVSQHPAASGIPLPPRFTPPADEIDDLPEVTFSELAQYDSCPLRYRLSASFGFQPQLAQELGYGKAIHHVLRRLAEDARRRGGLPTRQDLEALFHDEFYLPFANRFAFPQLLQGARALVDRYLESYSGDLLRVWDTERPFELHLPEGIVSGRADVILDNEGGKDALALVDYKTARHEEAHDVHAFQLAVYAAAGRGEGMDVRAAYLHELDEGDRHAIPVTSQQTTEARARAGQLIASLVGRRFQPKPDRKRCQACDVRAVCRHAACGHRDMRATGRRARA